MSEPVQPTSLPDLLTRLDWRAELLSLALIVAESCLIYLLLNLLVTIDGVDRAYPFWVVLAILTIAHGVTHLLDQGRVLSPVYEMLAGGAVVLTLVIGLRGANYPSWPLFDLGWLPDGLRALVFLPNDAALPVWITLALTGYGWWRGRSRAEPSVDSAFSMLRWGTLALTVLLVVSLLGLPDDSPVRDRLSLAAIGYFTATLVAVGFARLRMEGLRAGSPLGGRWLATFVAPVGAVLLAAIVAAGLFSRSLFDTLVWALRPVFWVLGLVFEIVVYAIVFLIFLLLTPLFWLVGDPNQPPVQVAPTATVEQDQGQQNQTPVEFFDFPDPLRYLLAAVFLFVLVSLLVRFLHRRRARQRKPTDEIRESVFDWGDLAGSLGARLRGVFQRPRPADPLASLRGMPEWRYTVQIRERYQNLERRGGEGGRSRLPGETPSQYTSALAKEFDGDPDLRGALDTLTERYQEARYSGVPATEHDARVANDAWDVIREDIHERGD
jgi:hypothetical protein